ncbi:M3 family oligoendopeptidase [Desulfurispira natronophila]|uniref:Oligoendopeptidase F n=1 Tax=Desulfurispira natronophila TaxID=682562 RepID=A0A7W7Y383_9BACT|nr:M3 family oligoendopeptidase [Desulfurispira natronophila]MBB5021238.1 oligoendopeptidase F [Desulfurispira natronophila]
MTKGNDGIRWDLSAIYTGMDDHKVSEDRRFVQEEARGIRERFRGRIGEIFPSEMAVLLQKLERINETYGRLGAFAFLLFAADTSDEKISGFLQSMQELGSNLSSDLSFFDIEWSSLDDQQAQVHLDDPKLASYHHFLRKSRKYRDYVLSEPEERIVARYSIVAGSSFTKLFNKVMGKLTFGAEQLGQEQVLSRLHDASREVRQQAQQDYTEGLKDNIHILTHIYNTVITEKMISDELRNYPHWVHSMNLSNDLSDDAVENLVGSVVSRYDIPQRYYRLKGEILGVDRLYDYDRYAPLRKVNKHYSWEYAQAAVLDSLDAISPQMAGIAREFFDKHWIDSVCHPRKRSGAFAHPVTTDTHPVILTNYTGNFRDMETLAHELGHGIHQYLARKQGYFGSNTPLVLAETASVFAEMVLFEREYAKLCDPQEQLAALCAKIESILATVFRQISMNRFEHAFHTTRRKEGELSSERISALWMETQQAMFGDSVELTQNYSLWWSYIPHFINAPGYVYSYAFGELLVLALYNQYRQASDKDAFIDRYLEVLSLGGTCTPADALAKLDVNIDNPEFWSSGLAAIEELVNEAELLYKKQQFR